MIDRSIETWIVFCVECLRWHGRVQRLAIGGSPPRRLVADPVFQESRADRFALQQAPSVIYFVGNHVRSARFHS